MALPQIRGHFPHPHSTLTLNFNGDINAEIISRINSCKFIIADFTENRGGVYFEAGYAHGLKKNVIFTCQEKYFRDYKPHFDVEHYNFLLWNDENLDIFKQQLKDRIVITIV